MNRAPVIVGTPPTSVKVGQIYGFTPSASDPDGQTLTFSITNKPAWATFSTATGRLSGIPTAIGTHSAITIAVFDGMTKVSLAAFSIAVVPAANRAPVISGTPPATASVGQTYGFTPTASDPDGQTLTFSITNKPAWATFSTATGKLSGVPTAAGTHSAIMIAASDGTAKVSLATFSIAVTPAANRAPVIGGTPPSSVKVGQAYSFTPTASDPDGQTLTFSITNKPAWANFSYATGKLSGTPTSTGTHPAITISAFDGVAMTSLAAFTIAVVPAVNRAPVISGTPSATASVGQTYSFTPTASDPDGQALTFSITNKPAWATFSTANGRLSGIPTSAGTFSAITIAVSDGTAKVSLATFSIVVAPAVNRAPVISGTPVKTATVGQPYSFRPTAQDADGDPMTFAIQNKPAWATFDASNGTLYGTPASPGTFANNIISVSDGKASAALPAFTITVSAASTTSVTVSWGRPAKNTDGTPLNLLSGYRVYYGTASHQYTQSLSIAGPTITSAVVQGLGSGNTWYFAVKSVTSDGQESAYSAEASKALP